LQDINGWQSAFALHFNAAGEKMNSNDIRVGVDIGSTTVKVVVLDEQNNILFKKYERHSSKVREKTIEILSQIKAVAENKKISLSISGSAGLSIAQLTGINFVQEVFAAKIAVDTLLNDIDVVIELGGEDAKILFLTGGNEERMNGSCAGGTGAFIDQMASLLSLSTAELDKLSFEHKLIYNIASRCGVFAKSDIQPLLNQGASKADIAASIYQAIVNQTISGLAQGRQIKGKVAFLGGPLTFLYGLRERFADTLKLQNGCAVFPQNSEYFVAIGAALSSTGSNYSYDEILRKFEGANKVKAITEPLLPLFADEQEYAEFKSRHSKSDVPLIDIASYSGDAYLGIDAGSTTTKVVLISNDKRILYTYYASNNGEPLAVLKQQLLHIYSLCGNRIKIRASVVTGYGEELIKNAYKIDKGIVETIAHYYAAKHFNPKVDFIMDIGGQDMKCFKLKNGAVDSIMLNEACSSGCGSFIETFASALGYSVADFAALGLKAKHPVNLGSRCTVFMNSSVKQAQKDGAGVDDISAGLSISVIKNAVYKVIRARDAKELGENIVVQGGTFLNDAVLRAFELEIGCNVTRPSIAGIMGAYGCALYAQELNIEKSTTISLEELKSFTHTSKLSECRYCTNNCKLTINVFNGTERYISGNRCERPLGKAKLLELPNAYKYKIERLTSLKSASGSRGKIGIPLGLNMYENLVFWHTLFTELDFEVVASGVANRRIYEKGQYSIPSDTVCYPAKLMHGHIEQLLEDGIETIFYPCMPYNIDEKMGDNHYNCPVVAYYPELLSANVKKLENIKFLNPYLNMDTKHSFIKTMQQYLKQHMNIPQNETRKAVKKAYKVYEQYKNDLYKYGRNAIKLAQKNNSEVIVLAGRPYHADSEINHGIAELINSLGLYVISEDCIKPAGKKLKVNVLNQWTFHSRLYNAAQYAANHEHINLVQLVSFGCGLDAITSDELKDILEKNGRLYTQIKIDEISNLGAAKIRLRSLVEAIKTRNNARL